MSTSATRNENRLTEHDEQTAVLAMAEAVTRWTANGINLSHYSNRDALVRIGAHAIGCSLWDLRAVEVAWLTDRATEARP